MTSQIKEQFNKVSQEYDTQRPSLIPCYQDLYTISIPLIARLPKPTSVLDLGAGSGLFSQFIFEQWPEAQYTLVDLSNQMLDVARERFTGAENVIFKEMDFTSAPLGEDYDLIISALAIHHLTDEQKQGLYKKVYQTLNPGGIFVNIDQVEGASPWFDNHYKLRWLQQVKASGLDEDAIEKTLERNKLDKFAKLSEQLHMLELSGFNHVDCIYKYNNFVVFAGYKSV